MWCTKGCPWPPAPQRTHVAHEAPGKGVTGVRGTPENQRASYEDICRRARALEPKSRGCHSRADWAALISGAWCEQLPSIFETGNLLEAAKAELDHGEWGLMFKNAEAPFTQDTANKLMKIADDGRLRNSDHGLNFAVCHHRQSS